MTDRITYQQQPDNTKAIEEFLGGEFPVCPHCGNFGEIETETGPKACMPCVSRLLPVLTRNGVEWIDWGDTIVANPDGTFTIEKGEVA